MKDEVLRYDDAQMEGQIQNHARRYYLDELSGSEILRGTLGV